MKIKYFIIAILLFCGLSTAFASTATIKLTKSTLQEIFNWKFENQDDGMFFLLGPESSNALIIHVDKMTNNNQISDTVTIHCNATTNLVHPDQSLTCYGNFSDVISMYIAPKDFKNGAEGNYLYQPLN